jgi:hypothetical protein
MNYCVTKKCTVPFLCFLLSKIQNIYQIIYFGQSFFFIFVVALLLLSLLFQECVCKQQDSLEEQFFSKFLMNMTFFYKMLS